MMMLFVALIFVPALAAAIHCPQNDSRVLDLAPGFDNDMQCVYSGVLPIRNGNAGLFYTFFTSLDGNASAPVLLWLNGGPGTTSSIGLFYEFGPYTLDGGLPLKKRSHSWNNHMHLLFLDQPLGTGLSEKPKDIPFLKNETEVGADVHDFLLQFFDKYSEFRDNDFHVAGESYGGHYVPSIGYTIFEENKKNNTINLKSIAVGNGDSDPCNQFAVSADFAYQLGVTGYKERQAAEDFVVALKLACEGPDPVGIMVALGGIFGITLASSGGINEYNVRLSGKYNYTDLVQLMTATETQKKLHVPNRPVPYQIKNMDVWMELFYDQGTTMVPRYKALLEGGIDVLIYHGADDPCFSVVGEETWLRRLEWSGQQGFNDAHRHVIYKPTDSGAVPDTVAGYTQGHANLRFTTVLYAGHLSPRDQPEVLLQMMSNHTNTPYP